MSFAPLDQDVLFSTTIKQGPTVFAVWCAILASKDQDGFTALNPETLVGLMTNPKTGQGPSLEMIQQAWDVLAGPDASSKNQDFEGRRIIPTDDGRWLVVSHQKYRVKHSREVRRVQLQLAKQRQRLKERHGRCEMEGCKDPAREAVGGVLLCELHAMGAPAEVVE